MNARFMAAVNGRRFLRDRTNLFFVFVFPIALVLIIGLQFSSSEDPKIGMVVGGEANQALADSMIEQIETSDIEVVDLADRDALVSDIERSEEHTSELQSLMRNSYAVFCLKKKNK